MKLKLQKTTAIVLALAGIVSAGLAIRASGETCSGLKSCTDGPNNSCSSSPCSYTTYGAAVFCADCISGECPDNCQIISCSTVDRVDWINGTCTWNHTSYICTGGDPGDPTPMTCCSTGGGGDCTNPCGGTP